MNTEHVKLTQNENRHILYIPKTTFYDFGVYSCSATNSIESKEAFYTLHGQPGMAKYIAEKQTNLKNITLIWEIESAIPITEHEILYRKIGVSSDEQYYEENFLINLPSLLFI